MPINIRHLIIFVLSFLVGNLLLAQKKEGIINVWPEQDKYPLEQHVLILPDYEKSIDLAQALEREDFKSLAEWGELSNSLSRLWIKVEIWPRNFHQNLHKDWFLIFHPYNTRIEGHIFQGENEQAFLLGAYVPYAERTYLAPSNMSPSVQKITLPDSGKLTLYAQIENIHSSRPPFTEIELSAPEIYERNVTHLRMFSTFILGGVVLMIMMVILLNLYLGHKSHYYYLLYLFTLLFVEALTTGADTLYIPSHVGLLWEWMEPLIYPEHPEYRIFLEVRWYILIMVYFLFIRSYLDLDKLMPVWDKIMKGMIALGGVYTLISLFIIRQTNYDVLLNDDILASYVGLFFLSVIIFLFFLKKTGDPRGKFVIWGFSVIIVSASPTLIDIIVHDMPSGYADTYLIVGLFIEKIIFTAALSFRQRTIEQTLSIRTEEQKRILAEQNKKLEDTVAERTHELLKKTEELEKSMLKQKEAQSRMIDQEKMASLGQLTAGIAHEINNPINFVSSNIDSLWLDVKDLEEMLRKMKAAAQERKESEAGEELLSIMEGEDADFLFKEIEGLIEGIQHGAERTQEIVKGLRTFSRLDEAGFKYADIHAGLDATLRILKVQMGKKIRVHKEYGDLPEVKCRHGKMNQVFMNILSNAIQALEGEGDIWITTEELRGEIIISIKDSGKGMSKEVQKRIFEPFYTTKKIGEGTGLGMFISHGVIQNHKGYIEVISEEGKGTEFIIQIPVDPEQLEEK